MWAVNIKTASSKSPSGLVKVRRDASVLFRKVRVKLSYRLGKTHVSVLPQSIDIEPVNACNFSCPHCQVTHWNKKRETLGQTEFESVLGQIPGVRKVKLQGMGEPLLNKAFPQMLKAADDRSIETSFISNGSVMTPKVVDQLLDLENADVTFSIDGATAETFEKIRVGGKFDNVVGNVHRLVDARDERGSPFKISVWTVVTKLNVDELNEIVELVYSLGVDELVFQVFLSDWGKDEMKSEADEKRLVLDSATNTKLESAKALAATLSLPFEIHRGNLLTKSKKCSWPWDSSFIASNGDVVPCCIIADSDTAKMGNVFETDFAEIWNGQPYQELRQRISDHDLPDYCKNCYGAE